MPKVKSDSVTERRSEGSGWQGGQLFGSENSESAITAGGFKNKEKAEETLKLLEGRDISYQFQVINSLHNRARVILKRTKDVDKVKNVQAAVDTFSAWLDDYRTHSRSKENLGYLPLDTVKGFYNLAKKEGATNAKSPSFLDVYTEADGDFKKLRLKKVDGTEVTWDIHRNKNLKPLVTKLDSEHQPLYTSSGAPSKHHLALIMWGYSPEPSKVKKLVPNDKSGSDSEDCEEDSAEDSS